MDISNWGGNLNSRLLVVKARFKEPKGLFKIRRISPGKAIRGNTKLTVPSSFDPVMLGDQLSLSVPSRTRDSYVTKLAPGGGICPQIFITWGYP